MRSSYWGRTAEQAYRRVAAVGLFRSAPESPPQWSTRTPGRRQVTPLPVGLPPADNRATALWPDAARRQFPLSSLQEKRGESHARPASAVIAAVAR